MPEAGSAPRPDTSDMYAVHGVFRDTLGAAPALVGDIAPGDAERVALIANYYENVLSFLEAHHDGEEHLVFPLLRSLGPKPGTSLETTNWKPNIRLVDINGRPIHRADLEAGGFMTVFPEGFTDTDNHQAIDQTVLIRPLGPQANSNAFHSGPGRSTWTPGPVVT